MITVEAIQKLMKVSIQDVNNNIIENELCGDGDVTSVHFLGIEDDLAIIEVKFGSTDFPEKYEFEFNHNNGKLIKPIIVE